MFTNFSLTGFTWKREPILYVTLVIGLLNVVQTVLIGDVDLFTAIQSAVLLVFGFVARGEVTPVARV